MGVREGVLARLLLPYMPMPIAAVIVLAARIWWTVAEVILIVVAYIFKPVKEVSPLIEETERQTG
jgi:hypothetical protein